MFRVISIVGLLVLVFAMSACGGTETTATTKAVEVVSTSTPVPVATPDPQARQYALLTEDLSVMQSLKTLSDRGAKSTDPDRSCNYILPKMRAKLDHLDSVLEKLDEAGMSVKDMSELRTNYDTLAGIADSIEEICTSYGY
jgi:hypothetical protein